jgi:hypothetical protein
MTMFGIRRIVDIRDGRLTGKGKIVPTRQIPFPDDLLGAFLLACVSGLLQSRRMGHVG